MSDNINKDRENEIDDFFAQFDKISDSLSKNEDTQPINADTNTAEVPHSNDFIHENEKENITGLQQRRQTRSERLAAEKKIKKEKNGFTSFLSDVYAKCEVLFFMLVNKAKKEFIIHDDDSELEDELHKNGTIEATKSSNDSGSVMGKTKKRKKKKYKINVKKLVRFLLCIFLAICILISIYAAVIIIRAPKIDPDNIYTMLTESSVLYDEDGNIVATVGSGDTRTNIEYEALPENLINAFVAIEDKTFWDHNGFNIIRLFGAVKDSIFSGDRIGGTSTITQQLARNVYLKDKREVRSLGRKIAEAYYTVILEKALTKEQIIEAYLNTINLGFDSYGVQTAAQAYFSKDVGDLDLIECASLASLPKAPSAYALIKKLNPEDVDPDNDVIIYVGNDYTYVYNDEKSSARRETALKFMCDQGYITEDQKQAALSEDLKTHINPNISSLTEISSYYSDYVINQVILDWAEENHMEYQEARQVVYNGGLQIYTTMDSKIQKIVEQEFSNNAGFPSVYNIKKDGAGNVIGKNGKILLYNYGNYFDSDNMFTFEDSEYEWLSDGSLKLLKGKRLNFYKTSFDGKEDISIEFKNMYVLENDHFYSIGGGVILIPQEYKTKDNDGNAIISAKFFDTKQECLKKNSAGKIYVDSSHYTLQQKVVQPQAAMVITDYTNGHVKALVGGRNTVGRLLFNRATETRQPGSSIKPITVYGAALQQSVEIMNGGSTPKYSTNDNSGSNVPNMYGKYFTAASVIDDSPLVVNGQQWPKNWYSGYKGLYTLRTSVQQSVNVNAVKVIQQVGVDYASKYAKKLGITSIVTSGDTNDMNAAALALGGMTDGVSPLEMASAYGTYPNGGVYVEPILYTKVTNQRGEVLLEKVADTQKVVDEGVAFIMTDILRSVVSEGLAGAAAIGNQPVGGKTGTTTDNYDAWFVGFTPQYAASMWIGNDVNIELSQGSTAASRVWSRIMKQVCAGYSYGSFKTAPSNVVSVTIDTKSGLIPTELSYLDPRGTVRSEYFISGTQPTGTDNIHQYKTACSASGYLATPSCPSTYQRFGVMRPYMVNPYVGDIAYEIPHYYCPIHNPDPSKYAIDPNAVIDPNTPGNTGNGNDNTTDGGTTVITDDEVNPGIDPTVPDDAPGWLNLN